MFNPCSASGAVFNEGPPPLGPEMPVSISAEVNSHNFCDNCLRLQLRTDSIRREMSGLLGRAVGAPV